MSGLTETIAHFIAGNEVRDFPPDAIERSKKVLADTFACILAGAGSEVAEPLLRYVEQSGGTGDAPILGTKVTASPEIAAMTNGAFGHALDFDDVLPMMPGHPSAIIVAGALANLRRKPFTGLQLIEAHVIGIEVGARIGLGITNGHYNRGFHGTGTLGIFSAAAALAKIHHFDPPTIRTVFGIAGSMASGLRRNFGTMTKPFHTGWAARNAVVAADLARCGYTAAPDVLEARAGFFAAYGVEASKADVASAALGNPWVIVDPGIGLKMWACYNGSQRGMHGALQLREKLGFTAQTLAHLECRMPPGGMQVVIYPKPTTGLEGKFSLQYALAAGVLDGKYSFWTFTDEAVNRPQIRELLDTKIVAREDERCGGNDPKLATRAAGERGFVEVEARTTYGRSEVIRVDAAPGHPSKPLGWDDLHQKFIDCAEYGRIDSSCAERAFETLAKLEKCADMGVLVDLLTVRKAQSPT